MALPDSLRLQHMRDTAGLALSFTAGRAWADLDSNQMLTLALVKCLEIIGEAAANVSPATRANLAGVPWVQIVRMRNILIHQYFAIDTSIVWATVTTDLPELMAMLPDQQ